MRKLLLLTATVLALGLSFASAQNFTKSLQGSQDPRGPVPLDSKNNIYLPYHLNSAGQPTAPTFSTGGVGNACVNTCTDLAGQVTTGSAATTLTIVFGQAYNYAPACILQEQAGTTAPTFTTTTTEILATVVASSKTYNYLCLGANY
jgi:hypothetical protein